MDAFVVCPVSFDLCDAEWFDEVDNAHEQALDWSVELHGEKVKVYKAICEDGGYTFNPLCTIWA